MIPFESTSVLFKVRLQFSLMSFFSVVARSSAEAFWAAEHSGSGDKIGEDISNAYAVGNTQANKIE
jgi:hypothetical protein